MKTVSVQLTETEVDQLSNSRLSLRSHRNILAKVRNAAIGKPKLSSQIEMALGPKPAKNDDGLIKFMMGYQSGEIKDF